MGMGVEAMEGYPTLRVKTRVGVDAMMSTSLVRL